MDNSFSTMSARDDVEQVLTDFQDAWKRGTPVSLTQFFERLQNESPEVRESVQLLLVLLDQTLRWQMWSRQREMMGDTDASPGAPTEPGGRAPLLEDYVRHCFLDGGLESLPPEMVAHEFRLRVECGDSPTMENYLQRFPHLTPTLSTLLTPLPQELNSPLTPTKGDAPTAVDLTMTRLEVPASPLETTLPMSPEEMPKRRSMDAERTANFGKYQLLNEIARGAMGIVYRARQEPIGRIVALKTILAGQFASERQVDQFLLEAKNAGDLKHDNIVTIYDAGKINEQYFIAMAYIEGHSLADAVREKSMSAQRSAEIVEAVARALHFAHVQPQPVYHRDIKPANILMDHAGRPYITDFGIAKRVEREDSRDGSEDDIAGTPSYMPPEQTYGRDIGPWSDVYSTGALLYHLLTGRPPFLAESLLETIRQVRGSEPLPPRELNPKVDPDLEAVCLKCLEKDRTKRYLSAEHLADDLRRFLKHEPTAARPISQLARFTKWCHRNPAIARLATVIVLILASVAVSAIFVAREQFTLRVDAEQARNVAKEERDKKEKARVAEESAKVEAQQAKVDAETARGVAEKARDVAKAEQLKAEVAQASAIKSEKAKDLALVETTKERDQKEHARAEAVKSKEEAQTARQEAERNLQNAVETVNVILTRSADSRLKNIPGMEDFRKQIARDALVQLEPILAAKPNAKEAIEAWARLLVVQAKLHMITGENKKAESPLKDAVKEYLDLTKDPNGGKQHLLLDLVATYRQLGESLDGQAELDHTSFKRPLTPVSESRLTAAVKEYENALAIQDRRPAAVATDCRWEIELARTHQLRCIALIHLKRADEGLESLERASLSLRDGLKKLSPMEERRDVQRQLASCYTTLAMAEALRESQPGLDVLEKRLKRLEEIEAIHEELHHYDRNAADSRFDLAMTRYSIAQVLTSLAQEPSREARLGHASEKAKTSLDDLSQLASEFPRTSKYEFHRIFALQLEAVIFVAEGKKTEAISTYEKAEKAIHDYNDKFTEASQPSLRLGICVSALELYIAEFSNPDIKEGERMRMAGWLKKCFGSLRQTPNQNAENPEAKMLESVSGRFVEAVIAEQKNQLPKWLSELKSVELDLRGYGKTIPDPNASGESLRLQIFEQALRKAILFKKGDPTTYTDTLNWIFLALPELTKSKDPNVAASAAKLLKFVSEPKGKL